MILIKVVVQRNYHLYFFIDINIEMKIEKVIVEDAQRLTALTIRSKSHWNYTKEQIESWREELKITEE